METDLTIRLNTCAATADAQIPAKTSLYADALACSASSSAAASAGIICSHTRFLQGDSPPQYLRPGQDELDVLIADKPASKPADHPADHTDLAVAEPTDENTALRRLPMPPGNDTLAKLALGAAGIPAIKGRNG